MKKKIIKYIIVCLIILASFFVLVTVYLYKRPFVIEENNIYTEAPLKTAKDSKLVLDTDAAGFNALAANFINAGVLREGLFANGVACYIGNSGEEANEAYVSITDSRFNMPVTFKCLWDISYNGGEAELSIYDVRLGAYEIPYLGILLWRVLGIPENIKFITKKTDKLVYLSSIDYDSGETVTLTYDYDGEALKEAFNDVMKNADKRKIEFHREKGDIGEDIMNLAENGEATSQIAFSLIDNFEKSPDSFLSLCYLLDADGIRKLYSYFGEYYYKHAEPEELIEVSENEIDSDLNEFDILFSHMLLQYLYRNPDYTVKNSKLYLRGSEITPQMVFSGINDIVYDVEIKEENGAIMIKYGLSDYEVWKTALKGAD